MDRIIILEVGEENLKIFDEILEVIQKHSAVRQYEFYAQTSVELNGLMIDYGSRKVFCQEKEVELTVKEYEVLRLLTSHRGQVLTYEQIYQNIWGEESFGNVNNAVGCHIRNVRRKLLQAYPDAPFRIRSIREIGYSFEVNNISHTKEETDV